VTQPETIERTDTLHVSTHPAVLHKLGVLRDQATEPKKFREVVRELSWLLGYEALQDAKTRRSTSRHRWSRWSQASSASGSV
jgi:uracil phosphoribosyltransferase